MSKGVEVLLWDLNRALYRAFFADAQVSARWLLIKDELDVETRKALCFGLCSLEPIPDSVIDYFTELYRREKAATTTGEAASPDGERGA